MPWVRFLAPFDYQVTPRVVIAYSAGHCCLVKQECAAQAVAAGKAAPAERPAQTKADCHAGE